MAVKRYNGTSWDTVAGLGAQGAAATSSSITTWVKTATGGETSLTGSSDSSTTLAYTPGQEQLFINGVLQVRGSDYTATNGTSITGLAALVAGDIATVTTVNAFSVTGAVPLSTVTANGDLIVGTSSGAVGRLGIGSTDQVLKVSGGVPTWATASSGALTLIKRASFSNVATTGTTFDSVFSSTYKVYMVVIETLEASTASHDPQFQLLYSGTTDTGTYRGASVQFPYTGTLTPYSIQTGSTTQFTLAQAAGNAGFDLRATIYFGNVGNSSQYPNWWGNGICGDEFSPFNMAGGLLSTRTFTGVLFKSSSSNITGTVAVYGLATA